MKSKTKAIALSAVTIGCCTAIIAGASIAAFSSSDEYDFQVQSGEISISTSLDLTSMSYVDENGKVNGTQNDDNGDNSIVLENGLGNATVVSGQGNAAASVEILLGQGVSANFTLTVTNQSTVGMKYVAYLVADRATPYTIDGAAMENNSYILTSEGGTKGWSTVGVSKEPIELSFSIGLPWGAGETDPAPSNMTLIVSAVQSNANGMISMGGDTYSTLLDAMEAAEDGDVLFLDPLAASASYQWPSRDEIVSLGDKQLTIVGTGTKVVGRDEDPDEFWMDWKIVLPANVTARGINFSHKVELLGSASLENVSFGNGLKIENADTSQLPEVELNDVTFTAGAIDAVNANVVLDHSEITALSFQCKTEGGQLTLGEGNSITNSNGKTIVEVDGTDVTVYGGYYQTGSAGATGNAIHAVNGSEITIKDGEFVGASTKQQANIFQLGTLTDGVTDGATLVIEGGKFTALSTEKYDKDIVSLFAIFSNSKVIFQDGEVDVGGIAFSGQGGNDEKIDIEISGGSINAGVVIYLPSDAALAITGGELSGETVLDMRAGTATITGGALSSTYSPYEKITEAPKGKTGGNGAVFQFHTGLDGYGESGLKFILEEGISVSSVSGHIADIYDWGEVDRTVDIDLGDYADEASYYTSVNGSEPGQQAAMVDGVPYETLSAAINDGNTNITLVASNDTPDNVTLKSNQEYTLTLQNNITYLASFEIQAGAEATICGEGVICDRDGEAVQSRSASAAHTIHNFGTLTIDGNITVDNKTDGRAAICNEVSGVVVLNGGKYLRSEETGSSPSVGGENTFYNIQNFGRMTINEGVYVGQNGSFSSLVENGWYDGNDNTTQTEAVMIINGGTFEGGLNTIKNDDWGVLTINDGTFTNMSQHCVLNWNVITINGGTFVTEENAKAYLCNGYLNDTMDKGQMLVLGGTYGENTDIFLAHPSYKNGGMIVVNREDLYLVARAAVEGCKMQAVYFDGGDGTAEKPFGISSEVQFEAIRQVSALAASVADAGAWYANLYYQLKNDVTLSADFEQLVYFIGTLNGATEDGKTYTVDYTAMDGALISDAIGTTVFRNVTFVQKGAIASFTGWGPAAYGSVLEFDNVTTRTPKGEYIGDRDLLATNIGAFISQGQNGSQITFRNCVNYSDIYARYGAAFIGGYVKNSGSANKSSVVFEDCANYGKIHAEGAAMLVGNSNVYDASIYTVKNCVNYGTIIGIAHAGLNVGLGGAAYDNVFDETRLMNKEDGTVKLTGVSVTVNVDSDGEITADYTSTGEQITKAVVYLHSYLYVCKEDDVSSQYGTALTYFDQEEVVVSGTSEASGTVTEITLKRCNVVDTRTEVTPIEGTVNSTPEGIQKAKTADGSTVYYVPDEFTYYGFENYQDAAYLVNKSNLVITPTVSVFLYNAAGDVVAIGTK